MILKWNWLVDTIGKGEEDEDEEEKRIVGRNFFFEFFCILFFEFFFVAAVVPEIFEKKNSPCFPIEPEIVLQSGNILHNIQNTSNQPNGKTNAKMLENAVKFESTVISVDFDEVDPEEVEILHDKSNMNEEKILVF